MKLKRGYFRIDKRRLLLGAIVWGLLSLVFTPEEENRAKEGFNEFPVGEQSAERERAVKGSGGGVRGAA